MTAFSQTSPNTVEEMEVFRFEADDTTYVMFYADDYKKLLEIGRENVLLNDIKDSLTISYNALVGSIDMFVMALKIIGIDSTLLISGGYLMLTEG